MGELEFSRDVVVSLVTKLEELDLTNDEQELLRAIFSAAGARVSETSPGGTEEFTQLRDQLSHAFLPESGENFTLRPHRIR